MLMNHTTNDAINSKRCRRHALSDSVPKGLPVLGRSLVLAITVSYCKDRDSASIMPLTQAKNERVPSFAFFISSVAFGSAKYF